jgi:hypothetical protein
MPGSHGNFVWYELMTTDPDAAKTFYRSVVGWDVQEMSNAGMPYTILVAGDQMAAGLMAMPPEAKGAPPNWMGYVGVDDVDAACEKVKGLGGKVHMPPRDIPDMGRFAVLEDPQGAFFSIYQGLGEPQPLPAMDAPRRIGWHELYASDWEKEFAFYAAMFGWQKAEAVPMGEMGIYQIFSYAGDTRGGMFNKPKEIPVCFWLYYITVPDFDAATERVTKGGGKILMGPMQVPGGAWIVQCQDPQGAMFALVGQRS